MAILDLMNLQPSTVSRDLRDKFLLIYGAPKVGKTEFAAQCPKNLIFAFEKGTNFQGNVYTVPVPKWTDFKALLKQLEKPELLEKFNTITIDTITIAWTLCEQYICNQNDVKTIGDIPYGKGYALLTAEFSDTLRKISMLGYGMILIAHGKEKNVKMEENGEEITVSTIAPDVPDRAKAIVNALVDIIGCIDAHFDNDGNCVRNLITRATPTIMAGSRLKYLQPIIPFGYEDLVNAIGDAIEKQGSIDHTTLSDKTEVKQVIEKRKFEDTVNEAKNLWQSLVTNNSANGQQNADKILAKAQEIFGAPVRLSEIPESKQDLYELLIIEMKALA